MGETEETIRRLASEKCRPCKDSRPYTSEEASERLQDLPGWSLESNTIVKEFRFKSYLSGLEFSTSLGKIADAQDHHPDMFVGWRRVKVVLTTHAIKGLSKNDFIMAANAEIEYSQLSR